MDTTSSRFNGVLSGHGIIYVGLERRIEAPGEQRTGSSNTISVPISSICVNFSERSVSLDT
jgi:hypothetical protein